MKITLDDFGGSLALVSRDLIPHAKGSASNRELLSYLVLVAAIKTEAFVSIRQLIHSHNRHNLLHSTIFFKPTNAICQIRCCRRHGICRCRCCRPRRWRVSSSSLQASPSVLLRQFGMLRRSLCCWSKRWFTVSPPKFTDAGCDSSAPKMPAYPSDDCSFHMTV